MTGGLGGRAVSQEMVLNYELMVGQVETLRKHAHGNFRDLAVGVYSGFMEAFRRVKPIPRTTAQVDFVALTRAAKVASGLCGVWNQTLT